MITDNLIAESVTLTLDNIDLDTFLNFLYENFTNAILDVLPQFKRVIFILITSMISIF